MNLYKCTLECKIKGYPNMVEYLRATNEDKLITMFEQCEDIEGSTYYGYKWHEVCIIKMNDFPEVMTISVGVDKKK